MSDVLDQSDIDALLSAVESTDGVEEALSVQIFSRTRKDLEDVEVRPYDFKRPERVSKDQMMALQTLHEGFARNFGAALSGFLRTIVEVKVASCEQMTYSEFIAGLPNPTSFNLLEASPLEGQICFEVSPLIIYPIIDRLLGGTNQELFIPQRPLTMIETRLINRLLERAIDGLQEAWAGIIQLTFEVVGGESNPQLVQIVPPNEVVVVVGFEIKMASRAGTMNLCIPFAVIEPIMEDLAAQSWFSSTRMRGNEETKDKIGRSLSRAALQIAATLAETEITTQDLMGLEAGDIIVTSKPASEPVVVEIEREPTFLAHIGQFKGNRAVRIDRRLRAGDGSRG
jgi:flagellar motor switch protein FliM